MKGDLMANYEIKLFDTVKCICVDEYGNLRDIVRTGIPLEDPLTVVEIDVRRNNQGEDIKFYICAQTEYPFYEFTAYVEDIYEIHNPPEGWE